MIFTGVTIPSSTSSSSSGKMDPLETSDRSLSYSHDDDNDDGTALNNSNHSLSSHGTSSSATNNKTKATSNSAAYEMIPLEADFEPTNLDVICARGKEAYNHEGNIRFRQLVADQLHNYQSSTSKMAKSHIVREIIESVRRASPKGGFVKKVNGKWFDVGERARREKTGQQIRDLLHTQYKSSTKAKARTRKRLRKCHSANSATRVATQMAIRNALADREGGTGIPGGHATRNMSLPGRVVTLDSATNEANVRSALAVGGGFGGSRGGGGMDGSAGGLMKRSYRRQHSAPDLSSLAARITGGANHNDDYGEEPLAAEALGYGYAAGAGDSGVDNIGDLNLNMVRDDRFSAGTFAGGRVGRNSRLPRIRETTSEPAFNSMSMNRFGLPPLTMNNNGANSNMNMGWGSASSSSGMAFNNNVSMRNHQGPFASSAGTSSGLLQNAHQRQQLSDLSGFLQQQQQAQPSMGMSDNGFGSPADQSSAMLMSSFGVGGEGFASTDYDGGFNSFAGSGGRAMNPGGRAMNPAAAAGMQMMMGGGLMNNTSPQTMMMMGSSNYNNSASAAFNGGMGPMGGGINASSAGGASGMGMMQSSFPSPNNMNTRPQDSAYSDIFTRSGRMTRPVPQPGNEDAADPLFLPVEESIFDSKDNSPNRQEEREAGIISYNKGTAGGSDMSYKGSAAEMQPQDSDEYSEESSEKSFEDAIDSIHDIEDQVRGRATNV